MKKNTDKGINRIVDNRGIRKTIHVESRKRRRLKPAVKGALIGTAIVAAFLLLAFVAISLVKNKGNNNDMAVSEDAVSNDSLLTVSENLLENEELSVNEETVSADLLEETVSENEPEIIEATAEFLTNITPTSFEINWDGMKNDRYLVCYMELEAASENHGKNYTEDKSMAMADICTAYDESQEEMYLTRTVSINNALVTGLSPNSLYDVMVLEEDGTVVSENTVRTALSGYCDPFKAVDSVFTFSIRDEATGAVIEKLDNRTVTISAEDGCLGTECRTVLTSPLYNDALFSEKLKDIPVSTVVFISADENNNYCYLKEDGTYSVHVTAEDGSEGWLNARRLMVDMKHIFTPDNGIYGIAINRTNAYSSIFTTGGDANAVDHNENQVTRFNAISSNNPSEFMNTDGYNLIEGITDIPLPNFGSKDQLPVIWDLAVELKQCQKNALENGYTLLIYEGYRPAATSRAVEGNLSKLGYLAIPVNGTNLAQGFLTDQSYGVSFYIAKKSRHNRGVATDLTLMGFNSPDELGEEIHMQTKMHTLDFRCNMHYNNWQADLLTDIMIGHGSNLEYLKVRSEWWHFQLKSDRKDLYPLIGDYTYMDFVF